jgi:hypothetical protein
MITAGGARMGGLPTTLTILGALAVLSSVVLPLDSLRAQDGSARVGIEFLSDGRCAVSSEGDGFRTNATYMPAAGAKQAELRCAMPPVPGGRTVVLVVSLPSNMRSPGASVPPLAWVEVQGRWVGTAQLTEWPDAVVVLPGRSWTGWLAARNVAIAAAAVVILIVGMAVATYIRRSRPVKPSG